MQDAALRGIPADAMDFPGGPLANAVESMAHSLVPMIRLTQYVIGKHPFLLIHDHVRVQLREVEHLKRRHRAGMTGAALGCQQVASASGEVQPLSFGLATLAKEMELGHFITRSLGLKTSRGSLGTGGSELLSCQG